MISQTSQTNEEGIGQASRIVLRSAMIIACFVIAGATVSLATEIFLILFLSMLFGVALTRVSSILSEKLSLPYCVGLALVTATLVLTTFGGLASFGVQINDQIKRASKRTDEGVHRIREMAGEYPAMQSILQSTPFLREVFEDGDFGPEKAGSDGERSSEQSNQESKSENEEQTDSAEMQAKIAEQDALRGTVKRGASALANVFKTTFGLLINSALIFFVGLFLAVDHKKYRDGVVTLFPTAKRERTREVLNLMGDALWNWLVGRFATMVITGVGAGLLLAILQVPMAATLGVVTALLTFIPNIGGVIALALAILFALPQGAATVLYVLLGYVALQIVESYVVTPLIQQHQVSLPPALLIAFQAVLGVLFGFLGAAVASPLLAASKVAIEEAYVKDTLESNDHGKTD